MPRLARTVQLAAIVVCLVGCEIHDQPTESPSDGTAPIGQNRAAQVAGSAGQIAFVEGFEHGLQLARNEQKPLLLFFTAEWCKYCQQMEREAFAQQAVVELSREFVCVLIDADAEPDICRQFDVRGFPTIQFVSSSGLRLNRVTGKQPASQLAMHMKSALQALVRRDKATQQR